MVKQVMLKELCIQALTFSEGHIVYLCALQNPFLVAFVFRDLDCLNDDAHAAHAFHAHAFHGPDSHLNFCDVGHLGHSYAMNALKKRERSYNKSGQ